MNATETIFALALASNCEAPRHFKNAYQQIAALGEVHFSHIYLIPCRDGIGADYWNSACLLKSRLSFEHLNVILKELEVAAGRVRPSHDIPLDIDIIAWGENLAQMQFNPKKLPLALDVKIPMWDIWQDEAFVHPEHDYPIVSCEE